MGHLARIFTGKQSPRIPYTEIKESVMIDQSQCETCESLAHELAEVKRENEQLRAILSDKSLEAMRIASYNTS